MPGRVAAAVFRAALRRATDFAMTTTVVHVVDDDELARKGTARLLTAAGFEVRTYASALEFLGAVEPDAAGCIILDVMLPGRTSLVPERMCSAHLLFASDDARSTRQSDSGACRSPKLATTQRYMHLLLPAFRTPFDF